MTKEPTPNEKVLSNDDFQQKIAAAFELYRYVIARHGPIKSESKD